MNGFMKVGTISALVSAVLMTWSPSLSAAQADGEATSPVRPRQEAARNSIDVVTSRAGALSGAVVNRKNQPAANAKVRLDQAGGKQSREEVTDAAGRFVFKDVRPGLYTLTVQSAEGQSRQVARVWSTQTAPPAATPVALIALQEGQANDEDVVRGLPAAGAGGLLVGALIVAGVVAAIAVPVAVANSITASP